MTPDGLEHQLPRQQVGPLDARRNRKSLERCRRSSECVRTQLDERQWVAAGGLEKPVDRIAGDDTRAAAGQQLGGRILVEAGRWNTQRPRPAIRFRNIDPPYRQRKVAP